MEKPRWNQPSWAMVRKWASICWIQGYLRMLDLETERVKVDCNLHFICWTSCFFSQKWWMKTASEKQCVCLFLRQWFQSAYSTLPIVVSLAVSQLCAEFPLSFWGPCILQLFTGVCQALDGCGSLQVASPHGRPYDFSKTWQWLLQAVRQSRPWAASNISSAKWIQNGMGSDFN